MSVAGKKTKEYEEDDNTTYQLNILTRWVILYSTKLAKARQMKFNGQHPSGSKYTSELQSLANNAEISNRFCCSRSVRILFTMIYLQE